MDKLDAILKKLESLESLQQQHGDLLSQLIGIVSATNEKSYQIQSELSELKEGQIRQDKILESLALRSMVK